MQKVGTGPTSPGGAGAGRGELASVAAVLLLLFAAELWLSSSFSLFTRQFWYDEDLTQTLVGDPSLGHALIALAGGVETHPPTYYLLLRIYVSAVGRADEPTLRSFALLCTFAGLLGAYAALRLAYSSFASLAAVLALAAHPLVLAHAVEARPYNLLLAEVAWFCYFLVRCRVSGARREFVLGLLLTAALMCTTHYFGVISLGLILAGDAAVSPRGRGGNRLRALALGAGLVALLACLPLLRSQRAAISVPTWLTLPDVRETARVIRVLLLPDFLLVLLAWAGLVVLVRIVGRRGGSPSAENVRSPRPLVALLALLLLPFVLLALSHLYQPVLLERYAMPAVLALALLVAAVCRGRNRWAVAALCATFAVQGGVELGRKAEEYRLRDARRAVFIALLRDKCGGDAPIVFFIPLRLSFAARYAPDLGPRCYQLDLDPRDFDWLPRESFFTRDLARRRAVYYGRPELISSAELRARPLVYLVLERHDTLLHFTPASGAWSRHLGDGVYEVRFDVPNRPES
jgi:hypothetical protein